MTSSLKRQKYLRIGTGLSDGDAQLLQVKAIRESLKITRDHGISQAAVKTAICLSNLVQPCSSLGIDIEGIAKFDLANVLWDQGEMVASIQMLKQLKSQNELEKQSPVSRAELLVTLVCQITSLFGNIRLTRAGPSCRRGTLGKTRDRFSRILIPSSEGVKGSVPRR